MSTVMQFGNVSESDNEKIGFELIESGYLNGENNDQVTIDLSSHQMYILFTREITISSGAVRGFRARYIVRTENDGDVQFGNMYASSNAGITTTVSGESMTIKPSATTYDVYYALYAVM